MPERLASPQTFLGVRHAFLLRTSAREATERLAERVWSLNTNPHSWLFTSVLMGSSLFQSLFLLAPDFRNGLYASLHCTKVWHRAYPECDATLWKSARVYSVNRVQALHRSLLLTGLWRGDVLPGRFKAPSLFGLCNLFLFSLLVIVFTIILLLLLLVYSDFRALSKKWIS